MADELLVEMKAALDHFEQRPEEEASKLELVGVAGKFARSFGEVGRTPGRRRKRSAAGRSKVKSSKLEGVMAGIELDFEF